MNTYLCIMKYNRIRDVIDNQGRTQSWVAKQLGVSRNSINKLCTNSSQPSLKRLYEIARVLGVSPCDLLIEPKKEKL